LENSHSVHHHHTSADLARLWITKPALVPIEQFDQYDRERLLELLLSQERVVNILYGKTANVNQAHKSRLGLLASNEQHTPGGNNHSLLGMAMNGLASTNTQANLQDGNESHSPAHSPGGEGTLQTARPMTTNSVDVSDAQSHNSANTANGKLPAINASNRPNTVGK
jgi:hypothetical protein